MREAPCGVSRRGLFVQQADGFRSARRHHRDVARFDAYHPQHRDLLLPANVEHHAIVARLRGLDIPAAATATPTTTSASTTSAAAT